MLRLDENIFGRLAIFHGFVRREQLQECLQEERFVSGKEDLGQVLLEKGYLTEQQLEMIREVRRKKARKLLRDARELERTERSFAQAVLRRGWVDHCQLELALLEQERLRRLNLQLRVGEVLLAMGLLSAERVLEILAELGKSTLHCASCDSHFGVNGHREGEEHRCTRCGGILRPPPFLDAVVLDGLIDSPEGVEHSSVLGETVLEPAGQTPAED